MKKNLISIVLFLLGALAHVAVAQNMATPDMKKHIQKEVEYAILLMDNGMVKESIHFLDSINKACPNEYLVQYELGYAYLINKNYSESLEVYKNLINHPNADAQTYQMLGNLYDYEGQRDKAIKVYKKGIEKFPNSGLNYCELGVMVAMNDNYSEALKSFETGIFCDPTYVPNYYRAAQVLMYVGKQRAWGMIYAETMALMPNREDRKKELIGAMCDIYNESITSKGDTLTVVINEGNEVETYADLIAMMYEHAHFNATKVKKSGERYTIKDLIEIRSGFFEMLRDVDMVYLFKYLSQIYDAGHWEAYNYWLFYEVMPDESMKWIDENSEKFKAFADWYDANRFKLSTENKNTVCRLYFMKDVTKNEKETE